MNQLSITLAELEAAASGKPVTPEAATSIASDLLYLFRQAQQLAAIPEQPITDAHVQMVIDSHEKGYAMIVPCKIDLTLALEVQRLRRAMNTSTAAEDIAWWKQEAEDCKTLLLERAKENGEYAAILRRWVVFGRAMRLDGSDLPRNLIAETEAMLGQAEIGSWNNHQNPPTDKPKSELLQRAEKLAEDVGALVQRVHHEDVRSRVRIEHAEWATATFGNTGPVGPLKHLSQEALETAEAPNDLHEWADMQFLFWDAQRKAGVTDEQITQAMVEKLAINKARQWPEPKEGEPRFHIKSK